MMTPTDNPIADTKLSAQQLHTLQKLPTHWVDSVTALYQLIDEIDTLERVALDTEFIKRDTYFPILALVQVNTGEAIYLVDAKKLDLTDFWQVLIEIPQMIWYACGEDLGIFYLLADCPSLCNVFDVQIGVAYLTGNLQVGYSRAVSDVLGVALAKTESQSDWLTRPLTKAQESYASDDVRYLLALHDGVCAALQARGLLTAAVEDSHTYAEELHKLATLNDEERYLNYISATFNHEQITVLQALVAWREALARTTNQPTSFIVSKQALREIIETLPTSTKTLAYTTINRAALRLYGDEILKIIQSSRALPIEERPILPLTVPLSLEKAVKELLQALTEQESKRTGIPAKLLLKGRWLDELFYAAIQAEGHLHTQALLGYRHVWLSETVLPALQQHFATEN